MIGTQKMLYEQTNKRVQQNKIDLSISATENSIRQANRALPPAPQKLLRFRVRDSAVIAIQELARVPASALNLRHEHGEHALHLLIGVI